MIVKTAGFSIAVLSACPVCWETFDLSTRSTRAAFADFRKHNRELVQAFPLFFQAATQPEVVFAAWAEGGVVGGIPTYLVVTRNAQRTLPSVEQLTGRLRQTSPDAQVRSTTVGAAPALVVTGTISVPVTQFNADGTSGNQGEAVAHVTSYLIVGKKGGLDFTFVTDRGLPERVLQTMFQSIKLLR